MNRIRTALPALVGGVVIGLAMSPSTAQAWTIPTPPGSTTTWKPPACPPATKAPTYPRHGVKWGHR